MEQLFLLFAFIFLVFIALTYDKTVTPTINWVKKLFKKETSDDDNSLITNTKIFNLYDGTIYIVVFGLVFFTYEAFGPATSFDQKLLAIPSIAFVWILLLFKIYRIKVINNQKIIFRGIFRSIELKPHDIVSVQDWLRGVRIVLTKRSLILWPFIAKQDEFKALIRSLNPDVEIKDMTNEATNSITKGGILVLAVFLYFGWLIWSLYFGFR